MKKPHTYYVAEGYDVKQYNAGIVRNDNEKILEEEGFTALKFRYTQEGSLPVKLARVLNTVQLAFSVPKDSLVVFHFPLLAKAYRWLLQILKWRGIRTAALIIDIDGIRDNDEMLLKEEINMLAQFTDIVSHNAAMKNKLLAYLPKAKVFSIDVFDYPFEGQKLHRQLSNTICFAGNIAKATFIYNIGQLANIQFNVYGSGYDPGLNMQGNFVYKGTVAPKLLPGVIEGSFGLVWDGASIEKCDGYLRYNNPHKLSLYLVAGLPVIVWKDSAIAALVEEKNIGFTVGSLTEIPAKLGALSTIEYEQMRQNVSLIAAQVSKGFFLRKVITEIKVL